MDKPTPLPEGYQHTRAITAIGVIQLCIDTWDTSENPKSPWAKKLANIQRYIDDIAAQTRKRKLSRGSMRAIEAYAEIMERNTIKPEMSELERDEQWLVIWWVGVAFIDEVRTTCPLYWQGPRRKSWQLLQRTVENFAWACDKEIPAAQERYLPLYLEISDAMEAA